MACDLPYKIVHVKRCPGMMNSIRRLGVNGFCYLTSASTILVNLYIPAQAAHKKTNTNRSKSGRSILPHT